MTNLTDPVRTSKPLAQQMQRWDLTERHLTRQMAPSGMSLPVCWPLFLMGRRSSSRHAAILQSSSADEIRAHFSFDRTSATRSSFKEELLLKYFEVLIHSHLWYCCTCKKSITNCLTATSEKNKIERMGAWLWSLILAQRTD